MTVYTVHEPPLKRNETAPDPERVVFVRDGFSFWAFLLTPLWMLWHRLWLVLLGFIALVALALAALFSLGASAGVVAAVLALLKLLIGFEASSLRRFTLGRRGWRTAGIVVGNDLESAERRFFDLWVGKPAVPGEPRPVPPAATAAPVMRRASSDIVGLFPEAGTPR
jgi:hypothetical protein